MKKIKVLNERDRDSTMATVSNQALTEAVYYTLLSLQEPMHGYGIMQNVEILSHGRVRLAAGTLYGAIETLLKKEWINALPEVQNSRKKKYVISTVGKEVLENELERLKELVGNGESILRGIVNE